MLAASDRRRDPTVMLLSREETLSQKLEQRHIDVPWITDEAGKAKQLIVQQMSARALDEYRWILTSKDVADIRRSSPNAFIFVNCVVDEEGKRVYGDNDINVVQDTVDPDLIDLVVQAVDQMAEASEERKEALKKSSKGPLTVAASGR